MSNHGWHDYSRVLQSYGITKENTSDDYMIVMEFASDGDIRKYIHNNFNNLSWRKRIEYLEEIAHGLANLHEDNIVHENIKSWLTTSEFTKEIWDAEVKRQEKLASNPDRNSSIIGSIDSTELTHILSDKISNATESRQCSSLIDTKAYLTTITDVDLNDIALSSNSNT
ncbi:10289_t:CDS:2, partial [Ambispora gerdemannii]